MTNLKYNLSELKNKGYAIFDWDNTCAINDVTETMLIYYIDQWLFKIDEDVIEKVVFNGVEKGMMFNDAHQISFEVIGQELTRIYNMISGLGDEGYEISGELFTIMKALTFAMYEKLITKQGRKVAYLWICGFFSGNSEKDIENQSIDFFDDESRCDLTTEKYFHNLDTGSVVFSIEVEVKRGIRVREDIIEIFDFLRSSNIDIYICSASFEPIVRAIASNPQFGYKLNEKNIYGMRLQLDNQNKYIHEYISNYPITVEEGKASAINKFILPKYSKAPFMIAGDSDGDYQMFLEFEKANMLLLTNGDANSLVYKYFLGMIGINPKRYYIE